MRLKAEMMSRPGNLAYASFGSIDQVVEKFGVNRFVAMQILDPQKQVNGNNVDRITEHLERGGVPQPVAQIILSRLGSPPAGRVTHRKSGAEAGRQRKDAAEALFRTRPETARAIQETGLSRSELARQAGIGRETLRTALYGDPRHGPVREDTAAG